MQYLISGHPRTRTAWLCALLNAHGSLCYHDVRVNSVPMDVDAGIADPSLACLDAAEALKWSEGKPRVCLTREDWAIALGDWSGVYVLSEMADATEANCMMFAKGANLILPYEGLENDELVKEVVELCTQKPASMELIKIFQGLKIEQHLHKAQHILPISLSK